MGAPTDAAVDPLDVATEEAAYGMGDAQVAAELLDTDLTHFFGPEGPLARALGGYEMRPSQVAMAEAVKRALVDPSVALIEAPTGTGKSIAYLLPAILSGKTVVVATANKSLQNQLYTKDIPFLSRVLQRDIRAVVVKGRSNFVCTHKWEREVGVQESFALYDRMDDQAAYLRTWLGETETGDVDDLPFVLNPDLRPRVVSFADDCLHSDCGHYEDACWVNYMRDRAAQAQVLITNHHLLLNALELGLAGERILPPASVYVLDEAHQLEQTATAVYETAVSDYTVVQLLQRSVYKDYADEETLDAVRMLNLLAFQEVANLSRDSAFRMEADLESMRRLAHALRDLATRLRSKSPYDNNAVTLDVMYEAGGAGGALKDVQEAEARRAFELAIEALNSTSNNLLTISSDKRDGEMVRFAVRVNDRRNISLEIHAAPINPAGLLAKQLFHADNEQGEPLARTVICTSATLATQGSFVHFKARCGIEATGEELILPTVFDYPKQAVLYQPALPAFDHKQSDRYYDAAAGEIERLLEVSRGRALCLFTSWSGLQQVNDRLQRPGGGVVWPLRAQGDAPRNALLQWFLETPYSVLLATRSFWEGVDIPGEDLSLVVVDKLPFPTPNDPLHSARMKAIEEEGRSSFAEYMTPLMTLTLKQGFGRLIRRAGDRGVVAILDERLSSKGYGRQARQDLPPARFTRAFADAHRFYQDALGSQAEFALNVWAAPVEEGLRNQVSATRPMRWRWQLLRLLDGKADRADGVVEVADTAQAEVHAMLAGLADLQRRVEQGNRRPDQFAVEIRCAPATVTWLQEHQRPAWEAVQRTWRQVQVLGLSR